MLKSSLIKYFKKMDIIGQKYTFEDEDENKMHKTLYGASFSLLLFITCLVIGFLFGMEVYQRKKPYVAISEVITTNNDINLTNFPIIINVVNDNLGNHTISDYLSSAIYILEIDNFGKGKIIMGMELGECKLEKYPVLDNITRFNKRICLNNAQNNSFMNVPYSANSKTLVFSLYKCNKLKSKCADDLDEVFDSLTLSFTFFDSVVDPFNYTVPIIHYPYSVVFQLSNSMTKISDLRFTVNRLESDYGWILDSFKEDVFTRFEGAQNDIRVIDGANFFFPRATVTFGGSNVLKLTRRSYMKVQELFAKVGGVVQAGYIIIFVLSYNLIRFYYLVEVRRYLLNEFECSRYSSLSFENKNSIHNWNNKKITINVRGELENEEVCRDPSKIIINPNLNFPNEDIVHINKNAEKGFDNIKYQQFENCKGNNSDNIIVVDKNVLKSSFQSDIKENINSLNSVHMIRETRNKVENSVKNLIHIDNNFERATKKDINRLNDQVENLEQKLKNFEEKTQSKGEINSKSNIKQKVALTLREIPRGRESFFSYCCALLCCDANKIKIYNKLFESVYDIVSVKKVWKLNFTQLKNVEI